jgi:Mrp family chromosome partitioning ATPase
VARRSEKKAAKKAGKRKTKQPAGGAGAADARLIQGEVLHGGLALYERDPATGQDGDLFHLVPADVARSLRVFVSRLQQGEDVSMRETITVTSALVGEGVTSTTRSLAAILAHDLDRTVCLLESNWWVPEDDAPIGEVPIDDGATATGRRGLADVLRGSCNIDDVLLRTNDDRFAVLTAGRMAIGDRPAAVASAAYADALSMLVKDYDTVVVDAPPVLRSTEAASIARHTEAAVLVVRQGVTTEAQLATAIEALEGAELLGVILNRASSRIPRRLRRLGLSA